MKKLLLFIVFLLILVIAALALLSFVFDKKKTKTQTISGTVTEVVVKSDRGDVKLTTGGTQVEVTEEQHYVIFKKPKLKQKLEGGVLTLDVDCDIPVIKCYSDLEVTVPAGVRTTHLESDSGDVKADLEGRQLLVFAHTDSGDVNITVADARAVDAQTDSGNVKVDADGHPLKIVAKSDSGDVDVGVPNGHYAIDADSDSGEVKNEDLIDTNTSPKKIEAKSDSGDVKTHAR